MDFLKQDHDTTTLGINAAIIKESAIPLIIYKLIDLLFHMFHFHPKCA